MFVLLFQNIVGKSIKKKDLAVLGNLACVLDQSYIVKSDPDILENLKNCKDLSDVQMGAMETLLLQGTSKYGQVNLIRKECVALCSCVDALQTRSNTVKNEERPIVISIAFCRPPSQWNQKTLDDLGVLPLYFSKTFWGSFKQVQ